MSNRLNTADDFHANVEASDSGCHEWVGTLWASGYGRFQWGGKSIKAHRLAYEWRYGPLWLEGVCVLHRCDNRRCVNPAHLFLGTRADNNTDKTAKARQTKGEEHWAARLNPEKVVAIRNDKRPLKEIAAEYGLTYAHIQKVRARQRWAHV